MTEYIVRAERKLGEMLKAAKAAGQITHAHDPRHKPKPVIPDENNRSITLEEAGISPKLSSRAQKIAAVPEEQFEQAIAEAKEKGKITKNMFVKNNGSLASKPKAPKPHDATLQIMALSDIGKSQAEIAAELGIGQWTGRLPERVIHRSGLPIGFHHLLVEVSHLTQRFIDLRGDGVMDRLVILAHQPAGQGMGNPTQDFALKAFLQV
jgi:hypothetical protein